MLVVLFIYFFPYIHLINQRQKSTGVKRKTIKLACPAFSCLQGRFSDLFEITFFPSLSVEKLIDGATRAGPLSPGHTPDVEFIFFSHRDGEKKP